MNFMFSCARTISHSFASLTREILFLPLEHKIHIFSPPCNILYIFLRVVQYFDKPVGRVKIQTTSESRISRNQGIKESSERIKELWVVCGLYIEDITRWREDMNFMFEWQEQYLAHENIKFISSSQRVMFFLLYGD